MTAVQPELVKLKVFGYPESRDAYIIRDFLTRSVVEFEWVPLEDIRAFQKIYSEITVAGKDLPAVMLPDGNIIFQPDIEQLARGLGWMTKPKLGEYDVSIFGAGPAGLSAAVYAASEGLSTVLVETEAIGGQAGTSSLIENYLGFPNGISGSELAERARQQVVKFGVDIILIRKSAQTTFVNGKLHVDFTDGSKIISKSHISATGVQYTRLQLPDENNYLDRGLYYGAGASEASFCTGQHVFVVGGGNSAGQAAMNFSTHADKVTLVIRGADLAASLSYYLLVRIKKQSNIEVLFHSQITGLAGENTLEEVTISNSQTGASENYATRFVFICIGGKPNTAWAENTPIIRDDAGYLVTGSELLWPQFAGKWDRSFMPALLETSMPGCFAAGDVRHHSIKRVASAVGEGAMAVTLVHKYLQGKY